MFGFQRHSPCLGKIIGFVRDNFGTTNETLSRTGPGFFTQGLCRFCGDSLRLVVVESEAGGDGEDDIMVDDPADRNWRDGDRIADKIVMRRRRGAEEKEEL